VADREEVGAVLLRLYGSAESRKPTQTSTPPSSPALPPISDADDPGSRPPLLPAASDSVSEILRRAEALGIPWKHILADEITAEERLRRYVANVEEEIPFSFVLKILPSCFFRSWRVRKQIEGFAFEARASSTPEAVRQLRAVFYGLTGKSEGDKAALAQHLWFAYQRILLLQRVRRTAAKIRGDLPERLALICSRARCSYDDAAWAVLEEESPRRGHSLDAAVRKVREEGFRIPAAKTEAGSLARLRRIVRASPYLRRLRGNRKLSAVPLTNPARVQLPVDTV